MSDVSGCVLQLTDSVTRKQFALRLDPEHTGWTLRRLLERYLKDCPLDELLAARRITPRSVESLRAVQDYVYTVSDQAGCSTCIPAWPSGRAARPSPSTPRPLRRLCAWASPTSPSSTSPWTAQRRLR